MSKQCQNAVRLLVVLTLIYFAVGCLINSTFTVFHASSPWPGLGLAQRFALQAVDVLSNLGASQPGITRMGIGAVELGARVAMGFAWCWAARGLVAMLFLLLAEQDLGKGLRDGLFAAMSCARLSQLQDPMRH